MNKKSSLQNRMPVDHPNLHGSLLSTKFFPPPAGSALIERPALFERLNAGRNRPVTLISAPAGYGKTSLAAAWIAALQQDRAMPDHASFAWLSLEPADSDPVRFWKYFLASIQRSLLADPPALDTGSALESVFALLQSGGLSGFEPLVDRLLNLLVAAPRPVVLVLDDYHTLHASAVQESVAYLIDHLPRQLRLVILTRSDPALPLHRLRARGQLTELRLADLRFSPEETRAFLEKAGYMELTQQDVKALAESTEGWPAGLHLAALALASQLPSEPAAARQAAHEWIASFSGQQAYILDYLIEEVLNRQPEHVQDFLLTSSILDRICAPLCEAVSGGDRSLADVQDILSYLERANLFLIPLDGDRRWFRYHHLFADLLRARLRQSDPALETELHRRAAAWFETHDLIEEAVRHALSGKDWPLAARLVETAWRQPVEAGEIFTSLAWLEALPTEVTRSSAHLSFAFCWVLWLVGRFHAIASHLEDATRALASPSASRQPDYAFLKCQVALVRSIVERHAGNFQAAIASAQDALGQADALVFPPTDEMGVLTRGVARYHLAEAYRLAGFPGAAEPAFGLAVSILGRRSVVASANAYFLRCKIQQEMGKLRQAASTAGEGLRFAAEHPNPALPAFALVHLAAAEVACERDDLEKTGFHLGRAIELDRGNISVLRHGASLRIRLACSQGTWDEAVDALEQAERAIREVEAPYLLPELAAAQARVWIEVGELGKAEEWAYNAHLHPGIQPGEHVEAGLLAYARLLCAQQRPHQALPVLQSCLQAAESTGRMGSALEILLLQAFAEDRAGSQNKALDCLTRALQLAEPEGYLRIFIDWGEPIRKLLRLTQAVLPFGLPTAYIDRLLAAFPTEDPLSRLAEPLSPREHDVLRLLARGLSNAEIAREIIVSEGTIKTHVHHILAKLDAGSRSQAIAIARDLKII